MQLTKTERTLLQRMAQRGGKACPQGAREMNAGGKLLKQGLCEVSSVHQGMYYRNRGSGNCRWSQPVYYTEITYQITQSGIELLDGVNE
jgi:hypothetical protein